MKKIYLLILCFGIVFFAISVPFVNKKNIFNGNIFTKEKEGEKKPQKLANKKKIFAPNKNLNVKAKKLGVVVTTISAVQTVTVQGGGNAVPGGQLNYSFILSNTGDAANNVSFTDQLINDLTLVPGSVKSTPITQNESYQSIGNVGITVPVGSGVLANDISPTGETMTATVGTATTNGILNLATNGSFTYFPNAGYVGNDSFTYTVTTGTTSSTGTVTIQVSGMIWFVDPMIGASGTGTLQSPFKNMSDVTGTADGNTIFVYAGAPTGAITLLNNQKIVGKGATTSLVGPGSISGISTTPTFSNLLPTTGGTRPEWSNTTTALTLASGNDIEGVNITTSGGTSITGASVGALKINEVALNNTNGQALQIGAGGVINVVFDYISSANGAKGISVNNVSGVFQVTGAGNTVGSGGTILAKTTRGAEFISCSNISLKNMNFVNANTTDGAVSSETDNTGANAAIYARTVNGLSLDNIQMNTTTGNANAQHGISLNAVNNFNLANSTITRCGTSDDKEACIFAVNTSGTNTISNTTLSKASRITRWSNTNTNMTLRITSSSFNDTRTFHDSNTLNAAGQSGILFQGLGSSQMSLDVKSSCNFLRIASQGVNVIANGSALVNADVLNSTFNSTNALLPAGEDVGVGTVMEAAGSSTIRFNVKNNSITGRGGNLIGFGTLPTSTAKMEGTVEGNTVNYNFVSAVSNNGGYGIDYTHLGTNTDSRIKINNNTLTNFKADGVLGISSTIQAGRANVICTNNNITHQPVGIMAASYAIRISVTVAGASGCARVASNNVTNNANASGYAQMRASVVGTSFDIEGSGNLATPELSIWNFNANTPNIITNVSPTFISSGGAGARALVAANTCLAPNNGMLNLRLGADEAIAIDSKSEAIDNKIEEATEIIDESGINTDFGVNKSSIITNKTNENISSSGAKGTDASGLSGETITVNGSGAGFTLPSGKTTTITFSATIANPTVACDMTNIASVSGSNFSTVNSNSISEPLVIPPITSSTISSPTVCSGGTINLTAVCPVGSTTNWYTENGGGTAVLLDNSNYSPTNITANTSYFAACQIGACVSTRTLIGSVTVNANPDATITAPSAVCQGAPLNLSVPDAGTGASYLWAGNGIPPNSTSNTAIATPTALGTQTYSVTVTSSAGCTSSSSKTVTINPTPVVTLPTIPTLCYGEQASLTANCVMNVSAVLNGTSEVPANGSTATGYVYGTYNTLTNQLDLTMVYNGLSSNITNAHIHAGAAGVSGSPIVFFSGWPANTTSGSFTYSGTGLPSANKAAFLAGDTYVNIHSVNFGGGEIRGQLMVSCAADTYTWNTLETGPTIQIWPAATQNYTVTASNSITGCSSVPVSTTVNVTPLTLPAVASTVTKDVTTLTYFFTPTCENIAEVNPNGPGPLVAGNVTAKVWVETTPPFTYVPRHYEITPATNPAGVNGYITLYFSQKDFDDFNSTVMSSKLPTGPMDVAGIANFQIAKFSGTSPNGLPGPGGYSGSPTMIPGAGQAWNTAPYTMVFVNNVWKVTFPVSGFSGFIATSNAAPLPVNLISFTGKNTEKGNLLTWKTSAEQNFSHFEIERSADLKKFEKIGEVKGSKGENYDYLDNSSLNTHYSSLLYRLKMLDIDGKYKYSKIISIENYFDRPLVSQLFPNPSTGKSFVEITSLEKCEWTITTFDLIGKILNSENRILQKGYNKIEIGKLSNGINFVKFENGKVSEIRKVLKN